MQPAVDVGHFQRDDRALVLLLGSPSRVRLVHPAHQGVPVGIDREHGVAFHHLAASLVDPGVPQASQPPGLAVGAVEGPPYVVSGFPTGLVEGPGRDHAALAPLPGQPVAGLACEFLGAGVVGLVGQSCALGEVRHQSPQAYHQFGSAVPGTDEGAACARVHRRRPASHGAAGAQVPEPLDVSLLRRDVAIAHGRGFSSSLWPPRAFGATPVARSPSS